MKNLALVSAASAILLFFGTNQAARAVASRPIVAHTPPASAAVESYEIDGGHSTVLFATKHLGLSRFYGRFNEISGSLEYAPDDLSRSRIAIEIQAASVDTNSKDRDGHLKSPDFLSVKEFPVITFESEAVSGSARSFVVEGRLTLHGKTKTVKAQVEFIGQDDTIFGDHRAGFEARFTILPGDFGIEFMQKNPKALGPEIDVVVSLECIRQ